MENAHRSHSQIPVLQMLKTRCWFRIGIIMVSLLLSGSRAYALRWGGTAGYSYSHSQFDTSASGTLDQNYTVNGSGFVAPAIHLSTNLRYRHTRSSLAEGPGSWRSEIGPTVIGVWNSPFFRMRSDVMLLESEDQTGAQNVSTRAGNVDMQTNWPDLPRFFMRYGWSQNTNSLDLLGTDTRQSRIAGGLDYVWRTSNVHYDYEDRQTRNARTGFELVSRQHTGRVDNSIAFFRRGI